jgi:hypothetical protein
VLQVTGLRGELRVGYQVAAELGPWRLALAPQLPRRYTVRAAIVAVSAYWLHQQPLTLALEVGPDVWSWPVAEPGPLGQQVETIVTGAPTIERGAARREEERA